MLTDSWQVNTNSSLNLGTHWANNLISNNCYKTEGHEGTCNDNDRQEMLTLETM